jgi:hypothetical protein
MKLDKPEGYEIAVLIAALQHTHGWVNLSPKKQDELLEHTSYLQKYRLVRRLGEFGELLELTQVQQLLDGEEMEMSDYLRLIYPKHHQRTIFRKQAIFEDLAATIPNSILRRITAMGQDVIGKFDRIATAALGDIRNAIKEMPLLPVTTDKPAQKYLEEIEGKLAEERRNRRKIGHRPENDEILAAEKASQDVLKYLRSCGFERTAQKRQWLVRVVGWVMEDQEIKGTLHARKLTRRND